MTPRAGLVVASVPALALLVGLFGGGLLLAVVRALGVYPAYGMHTPTLGYFRNALAEPWFWSSLALSGRVAFLSTVMAVSCGTALACGAALVFRHSRWARACLRLPLFLPHVVVANMVLVIFGQSGLFPRMLFALGGISDMGEAPSLVYDPWGIGIALGLASKEIPFVAVLVHPFALAVVETYAGAARTLGARAGTLLLRVVLPMIWPVVATAGLIVFAYGFSSFEFPYVLGRTYPRALSHAAYELYSSAEPRDRPEAIAVGLTIAAVNACLAVGAFVLTKRFEPVLEQIRAGKST